MSDVKVMPLAKFRCDIRYFTAKLGAEHRWFAVQVFDLLCGKAWLYQVLQFKGELQIRLGRLAADPVVQTLQKQSLILFGETNTGRIFGFRVLFSAFDSTQPEQLPDLNGGLI